MLGQRMTFTDRQSLACSKKLHKTAAFKGDKTLQWVALGGAAHGAVGDTGWASIWRGVGFLRQFHTMEASVELLM